jgi:hypothetical protein
MGLWRGEYRGNFLGWRSPVCGPVHPQFVNLAVQGGLGWLCGFDELLCRCGLASNGPPGEDTVTDKNGHTTRTTLTLHGRITNLPAQMVEVRIGLDPPFEMSVVGQVEEASLFGPHLRLTATYTTIPGSNKLIIHDVVQNCGAHPAELQILYHLNLGPPFLEAGSRVMAPIREMAPLTARAAEGIETHDAYRGPTPGFVEQVYAYDLAANPSDRTLALLCNSAADRAVVVRMNRQELPCFTVWKNTAALENGYVTGLEPGTNYPNFKAFERKNDRVRIMPPGSRWQATWSIEVVESSQAVATILAEIAQVQARTPTHIHRAPQARFASVGVLGASSA